VQSLNNDTNSPVCIAVDAMGGDFGPSEIVPGAIQAAKNQEMRIFLVGDPDLLKHEIEKHDVKDLQIKIVPSDSVIEENEQPALALRNKPNSSILIATGLVKQGMADACVSMGSTGAAMASAVVMFGTIEGIERPALGGPIIGFAPNTAIIDMGSNVDCRPGQMLSFAVIGRVFAHRFWGIDNPRVALLSVGAETGKGNRQIRETTKLFQNSQINFVGNIEADQLTKGIAEVVICDGFVGNIILKLTEGLGSALADRVGERLETLVSSNESEKIQSEIYNLTNALEAFGGAPLLGVNGVSIVGHGRSKAVSITKAIETAKNTVEISLIDNLNQELSSVRNQMNEDIDTQTNNQEE
tara:strand:- start:11093 stop:12157 length:1065 start_codon:yes stop_codon:yes gene_type:complete